MLSANKGVSVQFQMAEDAILTKVAKNASLVYSECMERRKLASALRKLDVLNNPRKSQKRFLEPLGLWTPLLQQTAWMKHSALSDVSKRIAWVISDNPPNAPLCKVCQKNPCSWNGKIFSAWCSVSCRNIDLDVRSNISVKNTDNAASRMEKREKTTLDRYGVRHISQVDSIFGQAKYKRVVTMQKRYGDNWGRHCYDLAAKKHDGVSPYHANRQSAGETDISNRLLNRGMKPSDIIRNDRSVLNGVELDLWFPERKVAIEYNGMLWHSEWAYSRQAVPRHLYTKMVQAHAAGIDIINVFDMEWENRPNQIFGVLLAKLGLLPVRVGARNCKVVDLEPDVAKSFVSENHIQPLNHRPLLAYGLVHNGELISTMCFGHHPRDIDCGLVLNRFCNKIGVVVPGAASRLFKKATTDHPQWKKVISWSDNRWGKGSLYPKLGFQLEKELPPDYVYFQPNGRNVLAKQACTRKKLGARIGQTEHQRALELKMYRVFDCGKKRWVWTR